MMRAAAQRLQDAAERSDMGEVTAALSALCELCKKKENREQLTAPDRVRVRDALRFDAPKARKNAARLLSLVGTDADVPALADALDAETTRFVVPSILLALGAVGSDAARAALMRFTPPAPASVEEEKHCAEIADAHRKALGRSAPAPKREALRLLRPVPMLLVPPKGFTDELLAEAREHGFAAESVPGGVRVETDDLAGLYRCRCLVEALIPCGRVPFVPSDIAAAAKRGWAGFCADADAPSLPYRIELRHCAEDRAAHIRRIALAVGGADDPSAYAWELRVDCLSDGKARVFVKPCVQGDRRFAYRKGALPASIHPVTAAALARAVRARIGDFSGARVRIYDPCCGSATLLIELGRQYRRSLLFGTDIAENAVRIARENAALAKVDAAILQKNCLRFVAREPFHIVAANLPFGNRVGSHENNEVLYCGLVKKLPSLLTADGLAVLYTMEGHLLERCIEQSGRLAVTDRIRTDAGGLTPTAYFIERGGDERK